MTDPLPRLQHALQDRYRIERELGQGGMATVYLAHDLRHDRDVALKVLRPELAATMGPERFHREIQIAAKLQHPNILPLLDSGEAAGFLFYVMPFVEGPSLRERLAREGELPVAETARILRDVADALSAAHAKGVVHRDIKPENVLLTGRHALVADFGVAKAVSEATGRQTLTTAGVALGTPTYMAPEQAAASPHVDHRADLYAFGVMAYEMLAGQPPFAAATPQAVLAAHVTETPVEVTQRRAAIPAPLAQLIMRCLAKKAADRPQTADELLPVLDVVATPSGGITPTATQPVTAIRARRRLPTVAAVGATLVVLALVVLATQRLRPRPLQVTVSDITPVTSRPGVEFEPAIAPDGREVAFAAGPIGAPHLVIRSTANVAGGGEVRLAHTTSGRELLPAWSPDGDFVRFWACRGDSCVWSETGKLGGAVRSVTLPPGARSPAWAPDGTRVAFVIGDTIFTSSTAEPAAQRVAVIPTAYQWHHSLAWSPDGSRIALVDGNSAWQWSGNVATSSMWVVDVAGGQPRLITSADYLNMSPAWLDATHLLFVSNRDGPRGVYVVEVGPQGPRGEPRLVPGVADPHSISYSIAAHRLAWARLTLRQNVRSYPLGRPGPMSIRDGRAVTAGNQVIEDHDVSPDGGWLAYVSNVRGNMDVYKVPLAGGEPVQLTDTPGDEFGPRWSPDGREIVVTRAAPGSGGERIELAVLPADGGAAVAFGSSVNAALAAWSPSGRAIAFTSYQAERPVLLVSRDSVSGPWHDPVRLTDFGCYVRDWAPDGSGVLCGSPTRLELDLVSPAGAVLWRDELAAGRQLTPVDKLESEDVRYARDGSTVYVAAVRADGLAGVWAIPVRGGEARLVIALDDPAVTAPGYLSLGRDRLYLTVSEYESDIWVATLRY